MLCLHTLVLGFDPFVVLTHQCRFNSDRNRHLVAYAEPESRKGKGSAAFVTDHTFLNATPAPLVTNLRRLQLGFTCAKRHCTCAILGVFSPVSMSWSAPSRRLCTAQSPVLQGESVKEVPKLLRSIKQKGQQLELGEGAGLTRMLTMQAITLRCHDKHPQTLQTIFDLSYLEGFQCL